MTSIAPYSDRSSVNHGEIKAKNQDEDAQYFITGCCKSIALADTESRSDCKIQGRNAIDTKYIPLFSPFIPCLGFAQYDFQSPIKTLRKISLNSQLQSNKQKLGAVQRQFAVVSIDLVLWF
ncbi:MAG: hypothetical protein PHI11_13955 [Gallionella sp.]|nr:hypothetical protein [Gallionella sp.]